MSEPETMEIVLFLNQSLPLLAIVLIILAFILSISFYIWSNRILRNIELQMTIMSKNIDNLENISQSMYENICYDLKINSQKTENRTEETSKLESVLTVVGEIKEQIKNIEKEQVAIKESFCKFSVEKPVIAKEVYYQQGEEKEIIPKSFLTSEEAKYEKISKLIITYLKDLLTEKEQVRANELVYSFPNQYTLADIYQTLELMKERNQITWEEKTINPQSVLKLL